MTLTTTVGGIRVSTDQQADKYGPARQRHDIEQEAARQNLRITDWIEEAISGANDDRAAENQYYELARKHPGLSVIFSHPNRVGRHVEVTVGIARKIHNLGGTVYIAGVGSLRDRRNWKEFLRDAVDAEVDYSNIIYNLSKGKFDKAVENHWPEGKQPYGYRLIRLENGRSTGLERHPEHALIYELMRDMALANHGAHTIALYLNQKGIPVPRTGGLRKNAGWSSIHVGRILKNSRYLGYTDYRGPDGRTTRITYPALVTPAQFAQIQEGFERRKKFRGPRTRFPSLFGGFLRCAYCGRSLTVNAARNRRGEQKWAYYLCRNANMKQAMLARGMTPCPHGKNHRLQDLDQAAWDAFTQAITDSVVIAQALAAPQPTIDHTPRLQEIDDELAELVTRAVRLGLPDSAVQAAIMPLKAEREKLLEAMRPPAPRVHADATALAAAYAERIARATNLEDRRKILQTWQTRVIVDEHGVKEIKIALASE
ncbi:hypothetical protein Dxin01_04157 [Deinococcus xinjiangensis]|uniref:Recombinase domain-containing protein n=1 Tax=Deinococcus xinjiangensis TaxID=457454 RepID=A0ABP9VGP9_9DEIO